MKPVVELNGISKRFRRYRQTNLRSAISDFTNRFISRSDPQLLEEKWLWAVKDLSFQVFPGQTLGIIGPNGAGKTTTLKILSQITQPTSGSMEVDGRISALIELGAGFHPELTGRENIFLNGTILGMRHNDIRQRLDEIVAFADLAEFLETPVKYYSSGMYARLGFAVAAHTNPDVILIDEVLAVGDYAFQQRCYKRMMELRERGVTIIFVSHNMAAISDMCEQVIVMDRGKVLFHGSTLEALAAYASTVRNAITPKNEIRIGQDGIGQRLMTHAARVVDVQLLNPENIPITIVEAGEWVRLAATIEFHEDAHQPQFSCFVRDEQGRLIYDQTTLWQEAQTPSFRKEEHAVVVCDLQMNLVEGIYTFGLDLHYHDLSCYYDRVETAASVVVRGGRGAKGIADLRCQFNYDSVDLVSKDER